MGKKFEFSYPYAAYMDVSLMRETHSRKELIAEFRAMQKEANRRLKELERTKWTQESQAYQRNKGKYDVRVFDLYHMTKNELSKRMREAAQFLGASSSTLKGQRRARARLVDTFREEWGLSFITRNNVADFSRFLEAARAHYGAGYYSMTEMEALFRTARKDEKFDIDKIKDNFDDFVKTTKESENYAKYARRADERFSSEAYEGRSV